MSPGLIGRCGGGACAGLIDSTATAGDTCGVHSVGAAAGAALLSDGLGGSLWGTFAGSSLPFFSISQLSSVAIPEDTSTVLDIGVPGQDVVTNDGGRSITVGAPEPFTGTYFDIDLTANATRFNLRATGFYLVSRWFDIANMDDGSMTFGNQYVMAINFDSFVFTGIGMPLAPIGTTRAVSLGGTGVANDDGALVGVDLIYNVSTAHVPLAIKHQGPEGDITDWQSECAAIYLGPGA